MSLEEVFGTAPIVDEYGDEITVTTLFPMGAEMKDIFRATIENSDAFTDLGPIVDEKNEVYVGSTDTGVDVVGWRTAGSIEKATLINFTDLIFATDVSPLQLVQYCYEKLDGSITPWLFCGVGEESVNYYRDNKYQSWVNGMKNVFDNCIAAFYPEINRGYALTNLYDLVAFPFHKCDVEEDARFEVENNGKIVRIPRQLHGMRVWDGPSGGYKDVDIVMKGAPKDLADRPAHWQALLEELRAATTPHFGPEFIDDCLSLSRDEVKKKYM